jgi:hypothetical protein
MDEVVTTHTLLAFQVHAPVSASVCEYIHLITAASTRHCSKPLVPKTATGGDRKVAPSAADPDNYRYFSRFFFFCTIKAQTARTCSKSHCESNHFLSRLPENLFPWNAILVLWEAVCFLHTFCGLTKCHSFSLTNCFYLAVCFLQSYKT